MDDKAWAQMVRDEHERRRSMEAKTPREREDAAVLEAQINSVLDALRGPGGAHQMMMSQDVWQVLRGEVRDERRDLLKSPAKPRVADVLLAVLVAGLHVRARHAQG